MAREESEEEAGIRLATACCVVYILSSYAVKFDTGLMKALLLKPNASRKRCAAYDQLVGTYLSSAQWRRFVILVVCMCVLCVFLCVWTVGHICTIGCTKLVITMHLTSCK